MIAGMQMQCQASMRPTMVSTHHHLLLLLQEIHTIHPVPSFGSENSTITS